MNLAETARHGVTDTAQDMFAYTWILKQQKRMTYKITNDKNHKAQITLSTLDIQNYKQNKTYIILTYKIKTTKMMSYKS